MEYISYIVVAVIAAYIGWSARGIIFLANISHNPDRMIDMLKQVKAINEAESLAELDSITDAIICESESVNGQIFLYDKSNGEFLAQAQNLHQAALIAAARFPGKKIWHPELKQDHQTA